MRNTDCSYFMQASRVDIAMRDANDIERAKSPKRCTGWTPRAIPVRERPQPAPKKTLCNRHMAPTYEVIFRSDIRCPRVHSRITSKGRNVLASPSAVNLIKTSAHEPDGAHAAKNT